MLARGPAVMLMLEMNSPVGLFSLTEVKMSEQSRHRLAEDEAEDI